MAVLRHRCLILGRATGWDCPACDASLEAAEERQSADEARFHERAEAAAVTEEERWKRFGGDPRLRTGDRHNTTVAVNSDGAPAAVTPGPGASQP